MASVSDTVTAGADGQIPVPQSGAVGGVPGQRILAQELRVLQRRQEPTAWRDYDVYVNDYPDYGNRYDNYPDF